MRGGKVFAAIGLASMMAVWGGIATAADPDAATAEEVVSKVWAASRFLNEKGASGFAAFNSKDGRWAWKDSYVFVYDCRLDRMVAHPMRPDLVGRPLMQITDNNGKFIFKELCMAGNDPRGGWVEYVWTKPGAGSVSRKRRRYCLCVGHTGGRRRLRRQGVRPRSNQADRQDGRSHQVSGPLKLVR